MENTLADRALLFMYVKNNGPPDWAKSDEEVFARIAGVTEEEAREAFEKCCEKGWMEKSEIPGNV
jgi:hypothetical protein